jgi:hypothetical protein
VTTLTRLADPHCEIVIDRRYAPLYLTRWTGKLSVEVLGELHDCLLGFGQTALAAGLRLAYVNHVGGIERSSAAVRRAFIERAAQLRHSVHGQVQLGSWHVIGSPLVRGVLAMARWVTAGDDEDHFVGNTAEGIRGATAALAKHGVDIDIDPSTYEFPV